MSAENPAVGHLVQRCHLENSGQKSCPAPGAVGREHYCCDLAGSSPGSVSPVWQLASPATNPVPWITDMWTWGQQRHACLSLPVWSWRSSPVHWRSCVPGCCQLSCDGMHRTGETSVGHSVAAYCFLGLWSQLCSSGHQGQE